MTRLLLIVALAATATFVVLDQRPASATITDPAGDAAHLTRIAPCIAPPGADEAPAPVTDA